MCNSDVPQQNPDKIDGNGRTARLLMNLVLIMHGYPIANIPGDSDMRLAYYNALESCNMTGDKSKFNIFIANCVFESMNGFIRKAGL